MLKGQPGPIGNAMTPSKTALGKFFRRHRLRLKLSQKSLGQRLGIAQNMVSAYETGVYSDLNPNLYSRVCRIFGCSLQQIPGWRQSILPPKKVYQQRVRLCRKGCEDLEFLCLATRTRRRSVVLRQALAAYRRQTEQSSKRFSSGIS